jgi:transcription initiation factor TFIID subunit 8
MDEAVKDVLKVGIGQVMQEVGFGGARKSALDTFTDVVQTFILHVGRGAAASAQLASRTESTFFDMKSSLDEVRSDLSGLLHYQENSDQLAFAKALPNFPLRKNVVVVEPSIDPLIDDNIEPPPAHIPPFLPAFPDKRTYIATPVVASRDTAPTTVREKKLAENRQVEQSLTRLIRTHYSHLQSEEEEEKEEDEGWGEDDVDEDRVKALVVANYQTQDSTIIPIPNRTNHWSSSSSSSSSIENKDNKRTICIDDNGARPGAMELDNNSKKRKSEVLMSSVSSQQPSKSQRTGD